MKMERLRPEGPWSLGTSPASEGWFLNTSSLRLSGKSSTVVPKKRKSFYLKISFFFVIKLVKSHFT